VNGPSIAVNRILAGELRSAYTANSFLSVALGRLFTTAMSGRSKERQELADTAIPLTAHLPVIAARGGEDIDRRLFEPLGYSVDLQGSQLDDKFPEWDESPYVAFTLAGTVRLQDLLTHLYVLIPVLNNEKHYWVATSKTTTLASSSKKLSNPPGSAAAPLLFWLRPDAGACPPASD
jgi:hypothetical protein